MKLAVVSLMQSDPWGGSEELWTEMAHAALDAGHEVAVSVRRWPTLHQRLIDLQRKGARILTRPLPRLPTVDRLVSRALGRDVRVPRPPLVQRVSSFGWLRDFAPDVLVINHGVTFDTVHFPALMAYLRTSRVPFVLVCQANTEGTVEGYVRERSRELFAAAARILFVSQRNLDVAERQLARRIETGRVVRNPINLRSVDPVPWPARAPLQLASVARYHTSSKGQDVLLEALSTDAWAARDWRLRLYGRGEDERYIRELVAHYGLGDRVELVGHVSDIRALWAENHLLVLASRLEGTPLALVEAMLCGRPAVVTDVGGNTEWVEDGRTGWVAEASSARHVGAALERAWAAAADWETVGQRAREVALAQYDPRPGETLLGIVREAAGAPAARAGRAVAGASP
jgi:glycosyltransferase involved in cell wall biosynthesis